MPSLAYNQFDCREIISELKNKILQGMVLFHFGELSLNYNVYLFAFITIEIEYNI